VQIVVVFRELPPSPAGSQWQPCSRPAQLDSRRHRAQLWKFFAASLQPTARTSTASSSVILGSSSRCQRTRLRSERIISVLFSLKEILQFVSSNHW
jgi:hypothetical protein